MCCGGFIHNLVKLGFEWMGTGSREPVSSPMVPEVEK
jgi:hypothetical protein